MTAKWIDAGFREPEVCPVCQRMPEGETINYRDQTSYTAGCPACGISTEEYDTPEGAWAAWNYFMSQVTAADPKRVLEISGTCPTCGTPV